MRGAPNGRLSQDGNGAPPAVAGIAPPPPATMMTARLRSDPETVLWCDPLTGLVAYPSFASYLTAQLPALATQPLHLAIGDVDDLKQYVTQRRADDPTCFGHLAGNECMAGVGRATRLWADRALSSWPFVLCGTFGGDEVIIAAAGREYSEFAGEVRHLIRAIGESVPRTCSFSAGTFAAPGLTREHGTRAYRHFVSHVDEALFTLKARLRQANLDPRGDFVDIGTVMFAPDGATPQAPAAPATELPNVAANPKEQGL